VDRFDTWLNAQRGWRRLAIVGVAWYWPTAAIGFWLLLFSRTWLPAPKPVLVAIAVLALPAAGGLGSVMAANYSRRARNPKRKKGLPPFFMWRQIALPWVLFAGLSATSVAPRNHAVPGLQMISGVIVIALAVETYRYSRRFTGPLRAVEPPALADQ
jgi:hypothetical protein